MGASSFYEETLAPTLLGRPELNQDLERQDVVADSSESLEQDELMKMLKFDKETWT